MDNLGRGKRVKHVPKSHPYHSEKKKKTGASSSSAEYTHPWFTTKNQEMNYNESFSTKEIISPKVLDVQWLMTEGFQFNTLLLEQGLGKFVSLKGSYYPDLVKVFYSNLKKHEDGFLVSEVKGIEIMLTEEVFDKVAELKRIGITPKASCLKEEGIEIQKDVFYSSMLRDVSAWEADLEAKKRGKKKITYNTGGLKVEDRLLHYTLCWVVAARGSNHAQISEEDLVMMAAIKNQIKIDWVHVVEDTMLKTRRLMDYKCPYALLVSRILEHYEVPVDGESREFTRDVNDLNERILKMMKLKRTDAGWIPRDEVHQMDEAGPSERAEEPEPPSNAEEATPTGDEELKPLTTFERAVLAKLNEIQETQRRDYQELKSCFEAISERLDAMNIPYPDDI